MQIKILHEDNHLLILHKPAGVLTQPDYKKHVSMYDHAKSYIKTAYSKPGNVYIGIVNRLDFPVTGINLFAKTSKCAARMHKIFLQKDIHKFYLALTNNSSNIFTDWMLLEHNLYREKDLSIITNSKKNTAKVTIGIKTIFEDSDRQLHLIKLITGKKHQIRTQLSHIGSPIIGDKKYKSKEAFANNQIALHAVFIKFMHPVKKQLLEIYDDNYSDILKVLKIDKKHIYNSVLKNIDNYNL